MGLSYNIAMGAGDVEIIDEFRREHDFPAAITNSDLFAEAEDVVTKIWKSIASKTPVLAENGVYGGWFSS